MMGGRGGEEIKGVNNNQDFRIEKLGCHHLLSWGKNQELKISFFNILGLQYIRLVVGHIGLGLRRQTLSLGEVFGSC